MTVFPAAVAAGRVTGGPGSRPDRPAARAHLALLADTEVRLDAVVARAAVTRAHLPESTVY